MSTNQMSKWKDRNAINDFILRNRMTIFLYVFVIILFFIGRLLSDGYLEVQHVSAIFRTASFLGIVAIGQTLVILTGGIDLSVGPVVTMGNVFICIFMSGLDSNNTWSLCAIILLGITVGVINGVGISYLKIPAIVMTLAVGSLVTGFMLIFSHGAPTGMASPFLRQVGVGYFFKVLPIIAIIWIIVSAFTIVLLSSTTYGRKLYLTGASNKVAKLSGVNIPWIIILAYAMSGAFAALAGTFMAGYTQNAFLGIGDEYVIWSITAVVIGGTSLNGGKGGYIGTIAGALILVLMESILTIVSVPEAGRQIASGLIILIMITIYFRKPQNK